VNRSVIPQPWEHGRLPRAFNACVSRRGRPLHIPDTPVVAFRVGEDGKLQQRLVRQGSILPYDHNNTTNWAVTVFCQQTYTEHFQYICIILETFCVLAPNKLLGPLRALLITSYGLLLHTPPAGICCPLEAPANPLQRGKLTIGRA
jgi:hypothetical protein